MGLILLAGNLCLFTLLLWINWVDLIWTQMSWLNEVKTKLYTWAVLRLWNLNAAMSNICKPLIKNLELPCSMLHSNPQWAILLVHIEPEVIIFAPWDRALCQCLHMRQGSRFNHLPSNGNKLVYWTNQYQHSIRDSVSWLYLSLLFRLRKERWNWRRNARGWLPLLLCWKEGTPTGRCQMFALCSFVSRLWLTTSVIKSDLQKLLNA